MSWDDAPCEIQLGPRDDILKALRNQTSHWVVASFFGRAPWGDLDIHMFASFHGIGLLKANAAHPVEPLLVATCVPLFVWAWNFHT